MSSKWVGRGVVHVEIHDYQGGEGDKREGQGG